MNNTPGLSGALFYALIASLNFSQIFTIANVSLKRANVPLGFLVFRQIEGGEK